MDYKDLKFEIEDKIAVITLNRPKYRNAFSPDMLENWAEALKKSQRDPEIHAVILTGEGKSFCAGGDIKNFMSPDLNPWSMKTFLQEKVHPVAHAVEKLDKPLIAAINGPAYGAGMDMALMCDMRIASDRAEFCESYIKLGMAPGDGGAFLLPRLVGIAKAMEWLLTGKTIDLDEALRFGLINRVVPHDQLMSETVKIARRIADHSPLGIRATKRAVYQGLSSDLSRHLDYISSQMGLLCETEYFKKAVDSFRRNNSQKK
jgi:enoyl-CoA hydratase/carnithine racemase